MIVLQLFKRFFPKVPGAVVVTALGVLIGRYWIGMDNPSLDLLVDVYTDVSFRLWQFPDLSLFSELVKNTTALKAVLVASV